MTDTRTGTVVPAGVSGKRTAAGWLAHPSDTREQAEDGAHPAPTRPPFAVRPVLALALATLLVHFVANALTTYGFHRDEFLYLAMGRHLHVWGMDFPPFIAALAEVSRAALGDGLVSLRLGPAIAASLLVCMAALLAREFGGGRYAQAMAAVAVLASPLFMRAGNLFQPVIFDQLWWTVGLFALARIGRPGPLDGERRWWLALGIIGGIGLLTKFSILFFGIAVLAGILASPRRRALATPWPWLAIAIALLLGSPSVVGQFRLGFPIVGQMRTLQTDQLAHVSFTDFLTGQLAMFGPLLALAVAGLSLLLFGRRHTAFRAVGWTCVAALALLMLLHGKPYYLGPLYPALFGAGGALLEDWTRRLAERGAVRARLARAARGTAFAIAGIMLLALLPMGLPVLPPAEMARYAATLGITSAVTTNTGTVLPLPQDYADMLGWEEMVQEVARVYRDLPGEQRERAVLLAGNYGEAGALAFFGPRHGLPDVVSPAGSYWFFGPGTLPGETVVTVGVGTEDLRRYFRNVSVAGRVENPWGVPEEQALTILVGNEPVSSLQQVWPSLAGRW